MAPTTPKRRTTKSRRHRRSRWTDDDVFEMLAWLEVAMKSDRDGKLFKQSIVGHMQRCRKKTFTWSQIDQKVEKLWQNHKYGPARGYSTHHCLYKLGLIGLSNITDNWRATLIKIKKRVADLQANDFSKTPLNKEGFSNTSSRSTPAKVGATVLHQGQPSDSESGTPFHPATPRRQKDHASNHEKQLSLPMASGREIPQTPTSEKSSFNPKRSIRDESPSISSLTTDSDNLESLKPVSAFGQSFEDHLQFRLDSPMSGQKWQDAAEVLNVNSWACNRQQCRQQEDALRQELVRVKELNIILRKRLESTPRDMKVEEQLQKMEMELAHSRARIQHLDSIIHDKDRYAPFTKKLAHKKLPLDAEPLKTNMSQLRLAMLQGLVLDCPELYEPCKIKFFTDEGELSMLLERVLGKAKMVPPNLDTWGLINALISASICRWVFEKELQDSCLTSTPMLEACLSQLRLLDGTDAVRNLHFAANTSIIKSDYFQNDVIPKKAAILAKRLVIVLRPVFTQHKHEEQTMPDVHRLWEEQGPRLQKILDAALRVKSQAVISKATFEADLPPSGSLFLSDHMDSSGMVLKKGKTESVLVTLVPGVRVFASDAELVDYNNFRKANSDPSSVYDHIKKPFVQIL